MSGLGFQVLNRIGLIRQKGHGSAHGKTIPLNVSPAKAQRLLFAEAAVKTEGAESARPRFQRGLHQFRGFGSGQIF